MSRHLVVLVLVVAALIVVGSGVTATVLSVRALGARARRLEIERRRRELHSAVASLARVALPDRLHRDTAVALLRAGRGRLPT